MPQVWPLSGWPLRHSCACVYFRKLRNRPMPNAHSRIVAARRGTAVPPTQPTEFKRGAEWFGARRLRKTPETNRGRQARGPADGADPNGAAQSSAPPCTAPLPSCSSLPCQPPIHSRAVPCTPRIGSCMVEARCVFAGHAPCADRTVSALIRWPRAPRRMRE